MTCGPADEPPSRELRSAGCQSRSGSGVAAIGAETGGGLTGAAGSAAGIDAVRVGAASWTRFAFCEAGAGAETGCGLAGSGAVGSGVAIDAVRIGAASSTDGLVPRRSWTRTPAASVARSVIGTMSVDFIVMRDCRSCRKSPNHQFHPHLASTTLTRRLALTWLS